MVGKHVAESLGGKAATIAIPNAIQLRGWGDVRGGIAVKQMDEGPGDAFILTSLDIILSENINQLVR